MGGEREQSTLYTCMKNVTMKPIKYNWYSMLVKLYFKSW